MDFSNQLRVVNAAYWRDVVWCGGVASGKWRPGVDDNDQRLVIGRSAESEGGHVGIHEQIWIDLKGKDQRSNIPNWHYFEEQSS